MAPTANTVAASPTVTVLMPVSVAGPESVRLRALVPDGSATEKSPFQTDALARVRAAALEKIVPPLSVSVPVPRTVPLMRPRAPASSCTPPVKVLSLPSSSVPVPCFTMLPPPVAPPRSSVTPGPVNVRVWVPRSRFEPVPGAPWPRKKVIGAARLGELLFVQLWLAVRVSPIRCGLAGEPDVPPIDTTPAPESITMPPEPSERMKPVPVVPMLPSRLVVPVLVN